MTAPPLEVAALAFRALQRILEPDGVLQTLLERETEMLVEWSRGLQLQQAGALVVLSGVMPPFRPLPRGILNGLPGRPRARNGAMVAASRRLAPVGELGSTAQLTAWVSGPDAANTVEYVLTRVVRTLGEGRLPAPLELGAIERLPPIPVGEPGLHRGDLEVQITMRA